MLNENLPGGMTFSVVIPAYNSAPFIETTLDSIRAQTWRDYEVVLTNDGSTDDTEEVIRRYAQRHPDFPLDMATQKNKGIGGARNNGVFRATAAYIAFLDADDRWHPTKLEQMAGFLALHPEVDVAWHDEIEVRGDGSRHALAYGEVRDPAYEDLLFKGNRLSTSATVVRTSMAQEVQGFSEDPAFNSAEDYEFWLRLARHGARFAHVPEVLGEYHRVEGSVTQKIEYHHRNIFNVVRHHLELVRADGTHPARFMDSLLKRKEAEHLATLARAYALSGARGLALKAHLRAMSVDPMCVKNYVKLARTLFQC